MVTRNAKKTLRRLSRLAPNSRYTRNFHELINVYEDLESTLKVLRASVPAQAASFVTHIDVRKLIHQLLQSKQKIEQKLTNMAAFTDTPVPAPKARKVSRARKSVEKKNEARA